ncbi:MAG: hypothetical protein KH354_01875 [Clostridiales bacterium]|nr:hypothetical protein [Clostridiales bacterium]
MGKKVVCLVLAAVFFVTGIAFAVIYRCLLKETPILSDELLADYYVGYGRNEVKFADAAELLNDSDAVFIVEASGERRRTKSEMLSRFTVRHVFKPYENIQAGEEIWIYEPTMVFFLDTNLSNEELYERSIAHHVIISKHVGLDSVNIPMRSGRQYLVCLKLYRKPEGYRYSEQEKRTFLLTEPNSSQFRIDWKIQNYAPEQGERVAFRDMADYDCIMEEQAFEAYTSLQEELWRRLKTSE